jgi:hypothetical protein
MNTSPSIAELAKALAAAQAIMAGARKDSSNPHFKSKYADLASVWDACREALTANGLSIVQATEPSERQEVVVVTCLLHTSGEWISSRLALPVQKGDAQGFGSALTYARRYSLAAMVGVAPEDDDGNAATRSAPNGGGKICEHEVSEILDLINAGAVDTAKFLEWVGAASVEAMTKDQHARAVKQLKRKVQS